MHQGGGNLALHNWAVAEYLRDNIRNARVVIDEGLRKCGNDAAVAVLAGRIEYKAKDYEAAQQLFQRAYELDKRNKQLFSSWPQLEVELGNLERARGLFERGLALHPNNTKIMNVSGSV